MKRLVSFFEIPVLDFRRAVKFYEGLFGVTLSVFECEKEKMACFPEEDGLCPGAISWSSEFDFVPSAQGVLVSFKCENLDWALSFVESNGGKIVIPKTKIEVEGRGWFAVFLDCEGNRIGLNQ